MGEPLIVLPLQTLEVIDDRVILSAHRMPQLPREKYRLSYELVRCLS